jgi:transcriptional regulator with XRE-family HTH domain
MENKDIRVRFGKKIKELRSKRALSQEDFADICGLDRTYISGIERGIRNVSLKNIEIIANALETNISKLFED